MDFVIFTFGSETPLAGLVRNGKLIAFAKESDFFGFTQITFPENALATVVSLSKQIEHVVFIGKPFLLLENLIRKHIRNFPKSFFDFGKDMKLFFSEMLQLKRTVRNAIKANSVEVELGHMCYVNEAWALAHSQKHKNIIVALGDAFDKYSWCRFEVNKSRVCLTEANGLANSFTELVKLNERFNGEIDLREAWDLQKKKFVLRSSKPGKCAKNKQFLKNEFARQIKGSTLLITDIKFPDFLKQENVKIIQLSLKAKLEIIADYAYKKIKQL
jgi:hypothetical protein